MRSIIIIIIIMIIIITGNNNNNSNNNRTPLMEIKNDKNTLPVGPSGEIDTEKYVSCGLHYSLLDFYM